MRRIAVLLAALAGCTAELRTVGPTGPPELPAPGFARAAFLADVDVIVGRIRITSPEIVTTGLSRVGRGPDLSLIGGDAVLLTTSNFTASPVGAFQPGKVRVSFDLAITNRLDNVDLIGPTVFPAPPPGTTGPLLVPYDVAIATTSGGVSTGGPGNDVIVVLPSLGLVAPSPEWDGSPWNFFNDATCPGGDDCLTWEEFPAIAPGGTTTVRRIGFDIDPTVGQFTARLIVAADLADLSPAPVGSVQGSVTSPGLGPIAGVTVTAAPGGASASTDAAGGFVLAGLPVGAVTLTLSGLPPSCGAQPGYAVTVQAGQITTFPLVLTCTPPPLLGTLRGSVRDGAGTALSGVIVTITPAGQGAALPVTTDLAGAWLAANVAVSDGTGTIALGGLPSGCVDPGAVPYAGLVSGGTLTVDLTVTCGP
ncbi:MAG: carboxypeptidase-like regulatory domain-containing protein [Gemmatimonadota bacterium]|nr:carboxypeptidase-like regulatory domain-containing protein [Gemmatimonadota bacterium]